MNLLKLFFTEGILTSSMIGMVIANRSMPQKWHWQSGKGLNFVSVKGDSPYRDTDGLVVDEEQKPTELCMQQRYLSSGFWIYAVEQVCFSL